MCPSARAAAYPQGGWFTFVSTLRIGTSTGSGARSQYWSRLFQKKKREILVAKGWWPRGISRAQFFSFGSMLDRARQGITQTAWRGRGVLNLDKNGDRLPNCPRGRWCGTACFGTARARCSSVSGGGQPRQGENRVIGGGTKVPPAWLSYRMGNF